MREVVVCPICDGQSFKPFLSCKDYTVSQETFHIMECLQCQFKVTSPTPANISDYYLSESYISHSNKATNLSDLVYLFARTFTMKWKANLILKHSNTSTDLSLLDYGCGTGEFLKKCQSNGWHIHGVEPSDKARQQAALKTQTAIAGSLEVMPFDNFNTITLWHVLEHIEDLNPTIQKLKDKLSDSGTMFIAVPNSGSWDAKHYKTYWAGYDVPRHLWHFSQFNMEALIFKNGLRLIRKVPMKLDAFYVSLLSEAYCKGKSTIVSTLRGAYSGLKSNINARTNNEYSSLIYIVGK